MITRILASVAAAVAVFLAPASTAANPERVPAEPAAQAVTHTDQHRAGRFEFTVARPACQDFGGHYCAVPLIVRNVGDSPATFYDARQQARIGGEWRWADTGKGEFMNAYEKAAGSAWLTPIAPGGELVCVVMFKASPGERITAVRLRDSWLGGVTIEV